MKQSNDATIGDERQQFQEKYGQSVAPDDISLEEEPNCGISWNQSDTESLWDSTRSQNEFSDAVVDDDELEKSDAVLDEFVLEDPIDTKDKTEDVTSDSESLWDSTRFQNAFLCDHSDGKDVEDPDKKKTPFQKYNWN